MPGRDHKRLEVFFQPFVVPWTISPSPLRGGPPRDMAAFASLGRRLCRGGGCRLIRRGR